MNPSITRRKFLSTVTVATAAVVASNVAFAAHEKTDKKLRVAVVGGNFGLGFYFHEHPNCVVEAVSDLLPERREALKKKYRCEKAYDSLDLLLKDPKVEAVFIATPAPDHFSHVRSALRAGKHVLCAVPVAMTLEECGELRDEVKRSGLKYMMAETSVFRQNVISARRFYAEGKFGKIFSAHAEYNHPGVEVLWKTKDGRSTWRHGFPAMHYPTHTTSCLISVTGERLTTVSCLGWTDNDKIFDGSVYGNRFWNAKALFNTTRGTMFSVMQTRRAAIMLAERCEWHGEKMSFYSSHPNGLGATIVRPEKGEGSDDAGFLHQNMIVQPYDQPLWWKTELPEPLRHPSGHGDAHTFITHEFVDAVLSEREPLVNIYEAIAYTAPGIVAHQSSLKDGELMKIPTFDV